MKRFLWTGTAIFFLGPVLLASLEDWHKSAAVSIVAALLAIAHRPDQTVEPKCVKNHVHVSMDQPQGSRPEVKHA